MNFILTKIKIQWHKLNYVYPQNKLPTGFISGYVLIVCLELLISLTLSHINIQSRLTMMTD